MGFAGAVPTGGAPRPDPERVATIRYTIVDEPETCAAFAEPARATLAALNDRSLAETRSGDLKECSLLLDDVRDRVADLVPARLEPRRGLAGLFDSRSKRLKAFRAAYVSTASVVGQSSAEIGDRAGALARREAVLDTLWTETRDAITELDAHITAARGWLANEVHTPAETAPLNAPLDRPAVPVSPLKAVNDTPVSDLIEAADEVDVPVQATPEVADGFAPVTALPHPLETRLLALETVRATAISRLPLLRAAQNADFHAPAALKQVCESVEGWRADWLDGLGLASKKRRKARPDRRRLDDASTALITRIENAAYALTTAQSRRSELVARTANPAQVATISLAA